MSVMGSQGPGDPSAPADSKTQELVAILEHQLAELLGERAAVRRQAGELARLIQLAHALLYIALASLVGCLSWVLYIVRGGL